MLSRKIIDTHTHLLDKSFDSDRDSILRVLFSGDILKLIEISDTIDSWDEAVRFARSHDSIWTALGEHPHNADRFCASARITEFKDKFLELQTSNKVAAVGEVGLDYYKNYSDPKNQRKAFVQQLDFWRNTGKPIIIHCRAAEDDMRSILKDFTSEPYRKAGVLHCFSGSARFAQEAVSMGFFIGIDGPVTYKKNGMIRSIIKDAGLDNIIIETDSPYLAPEPFRGRRNTPGYLVHVVYKLAEIFNVSPDRVAEKTTLNAQELFGF